MENLHRVEKHNRVTLRGKMRKLNWSNIEHAILVEHKKKLFYISIYLYMHIHVYMAYKTPRKEIFETLLIKIKMSSGLL